MMIETTSVSASFTFDKKLSIAGSNLIDYIHVERDEIHGDMMILAKNKMNRGWHWSDAYQVGALYIMDESSMQ